VTVRAIAASCGFAVVLTTVPVAAQSSASSAPTDVVQRHHYAIDGRIRPLLFFWIGRSNVGEAVVTTRRSADAVGHSLLIGTDPDRAPRHLNRWGYIDEEVHGASATLIGLMTESNEDSLEEAEANAQKSTGERTFKTIRSSIAGDQATSVVTSIAAPADYSFREAHTVLDLAEHKWPTGAPRVVDLPAGTRPGFLVALAELMHTHVDQWRTSGRVGPHTPIEFVYHGKLYQLGATRTQPVSSIRVGGATYVHVIVSQFAVRNMQDGAVTQFSMTYGTEGSLSETPIAVTYQPRWWLQIELTLDDTSQNAAPAVRRDP